MLFLTNWLFKQEPMLRESFDNDTFNESRCTVSHENCFNTEFQPIPKERFYKYASKNVKYEGYITWMALQEIFSFSTLKSFLVFGFIHNCFN